MAEVSPRENMQFSWQDLYIDLTNNREGQTFESAASGREYSTQQLIDRLEQEIEMMNNGVYPSETDSDTRPTPRVKGPDGDYIFRNVVDQEWYDLISSEDGYMDADRYEISGSTTSDTFKHYSQDEPGPSPHQGWKVRVAAYPEEGRDVAEAVLPYLQENDISHKVMQDVQQMNFNEGTRQEGKFITIYPEIDEDRRDKIMEDGKQVFKQNDPSWNKFSINSNTKNAARIIKDLEEELKNSNVDLKGRSIDGKNGEEKQYGDSRIHFRYAHHFRTPAEIRGQEFRTPRGVEGQNVVEHVDDHEGLVNQEGELVEGSYIGDEIDAAIRPDELLK